METQDYQGGTPKPAEMEVIHFQALFFHVCVDMFIFHKAKKTNVLPSVFFG
jgi:hypothetical protein